MDLWQAVVLSIVEGVTEFLPISSTGHLVLATEILKISQTDYDLVKQVLLGNLYVTLLALFLGGIVLIVLEKLYKEKQHHVGSLDDISLKQAFLIGLCQSVSMIPGVSRAAATIIGGMFLGLKRETATGFSFLLAIPTMTAATGYDLLKTDLNFSSQELLVLGVGFIGSFITALLVVKFLTSYVKTHTFIPFGIYRIILSIIFWLLIVR